MAGLVMPTYNEINTYYNINANTARSSLSRVMNLTNTPDSVTEYQYAVERLTNISSGTANPSFLLTSRINRLANSSDNKIYRGYIRRASPDAGDPTSDYRLYFMYNPEVIQRSYVAYLDQQALDPYNTMYGSGNMAAPPGILDFSFELLFDRQLEVAQDANHPGTKVDYDYFDLVVRGVVPDSNSSGNAIPDNGIMMINPRNVTVVFGQDLTVQGRPYNASVTFEKFSHRMVPTRLRIMVTMKVFYIGPIQTIPNFGMYDSEANYAATVPYDESITYKSEVENVKPIDIKVISFTNSNTSNFSDPYVQVGYGSGGQYSGPPGIAPADIPKGPFPVRVVRNGSSSVPSNVDPIQLSGEQILELLIAQECPIEGAMFLWALAKRESGFVANVAGINFNGTMDVGLWQINEINWAGLSKEEVADPWTNVGIAMRLSNNGTRFVPWQLSGNYSTPDGSHLRGVNMDEAIEFFNSRGYGTGGVPPVFVG